MMILFWIITLVFLLSIFFICFYLAEQFYLFKQSKKIAPLPLNELPKSKLPSVTIQLPVYNEKFVIADLIACICNLDYPNDKMEVQILDGSTDETSEIIENLLRSDKYRNKTIHHIRRNNEDGYKAGALATGLKTACGEYIAIFDADFRPATDFLLESMKYFDDERIGAVQTRWGYLNETESVLTRIQAVLINNHFLVEQYGRYADDLLLQFSGTAGIWRKKAIEESGAWSSDTLIEDVDLSLRAQLNGWKIVLAKDIVCPGELPAGMRGTKKQQFRWMQGSGQLMKKFLKPVCKSDLGFKQKYHALVLLTVPYLYISIFLMGILSVPLVYILSKYNYSTRFTGFFLILVILNGIIFFINNYFKEWKYMAKTKRISLFFQMFPMLIAINIGISFQNTIALIKGSFGFSSSFDRTPKTHLQNTTIDVSTKDKNYKIKSGIFPYLEILIALYFAMAVVLAFRTKNYIFIDVHVCLVFAYSIISFLSLNFNLKQHKF